MTSLRIAAISLALVALVPAVSSAQDQPTETRKQKIDRLVKLLGADGEGSYEVREKAQRELEQIGIPAVPALEKASKSGDLEVASRAADALATIRKGKRATPPPTQQPPADQPRAGSREDLRRQQEKALREARKDLERQMPEGFRKLFKEFFNDEGQPAPRAGEDQERRRNPFRPRTRTWTWQLGPNGERQLRETKDVQSDLGLRLGPASAALRSQLNIPRLDGRVVNRIVKGGYADRAGLQLYDVIISVGGTPVRRNADLSPLLQKGSKVEVYRKSKLLVLSLPAAGTTQPKGKPGVEKDSKKKSGKKQRSF